jgi:hypothetical protein
MTSSRVNKNIINKEVIFITFNVTLSVKFNPNNVSEDIKNDELTKVHHKV